MHRHASRRNSRSHSASASPPKTIPKVTITLPQESTDKIPYPPTKENNILNENNFLNVSISTEEKMLDPIIMSSDDIVKPADIVSKQEHKQHWKELRKAGECCVEVKFCDDIKTEKRGKGYKSKGGRKYVCKKLPESNYNGVVLLKSDNTYVGQFQVNGELYRVPNLRTKNQEKVAAVVRKHAEEKENRVLWWIRIWEIGKTHRSMK
eukprot:UN29909